MSKRPPQINVRVPEELKQKLHEAAANNERSVNSEIVHRIEMSFVENLNPGQIISADQAKARALQAQKDVYENLKKQAFDEIARETKLGKLDARIDLNHLEIDTDEDPLIKAAVKPLIEMLTEQGYCVVDWTVEDIYITFN